MVDSVLAIILSFLCLALYHKKKGVDNVMGTETKKLFRIYKNLNKSIDNIDFPEPITHVYNPLQYAWPVFANYLERFAPLQAENILLGMNPGPWGMAQTGIPFGEISFVEQWMALSGKITQPRNLHPKRPIDGFACTRSEVSGRRLYGWAQERYGEPKKFFKNFLVLNYCPLVFMKESGANFTPDKLNKAAAEPLFNACAKALQETIDVLEPKRLIGVGKFAATQARQDLASSNIAIETILHPSPASPMANRGWAPQAEKQLLAMGIRF
jgi:single-strand selective monofunctional uracil DNA glycosylase